MEDLPRNRINTSINREKDATIRKLTEEVVKLTQEKQQSSEITPTKRSGLKRKATSEETISKAARVEATPSFCESATVPLQQMRVSLR